MLAQLRRKHRGNDDFIQRAEEALDWLEQRPDDYPGRIARWPEGRYRYKHGRSRVVYTVDEDRGVVEILKMAYRDDKDYWR